MHTKLAHIKNLKNLNIGTDRPMQQRRPRSDAAENKGMNLIWGNRGIGVCAFQDRPPSIFLSLLKPVLVSSHVFLYLSRVFLYFGSILVFG